MHIVYVLKLPLTEGMEAMWGDRVVFSSVLVPARADYPSLLIQYAELCTYFSDIWID